MALCGVLRHVHTNYAQQAVAVDVWGRSAGVVRTMANTRPMNEDKPFVETAVGGLDRTALRMIANNVMTDIPGFCLHFVE